MDNNSYQHKIILGVSGGIGAFKACELLRLFVKNGAKVRVVMTDSAQKFVTPLSFSALGAESVSTGMWDPNRDALEHVSWADWAELFVVAPATANIIAKMAVGIADEVLSTQLLAFSGPILVAPAMNVKMWQNQATQRNIAELSRRGVYFIGPTAGHLASLIVAAGRMVEPEQIYNRAKEILNRTGRLAEKKFVITAGPTVEPIDPVRYISNRSSGKMGFALAAAAVERGAQVSLISGPVNLLPPPKVKFIPVETAAQMLKAVKAEFAGADVLIMAAAVADFRAHAVAPQKIKRSGESLALKLEANPDILKEITAKKGKRLVVGFALETENLIAGAEKKLKEKRLDMIVANDPTEQGSGFGSDFNKAAIIVRGKKPLQLELMTKTALANRILDEIEKLR